MSRIAREHYREYLIYYGEEMRKVGLE